MSCGQVLTSDTRLDSDLMNCPTDGVVIGANGVTLDLAGHTIDGDRSFGLDESAVKNQDFDDFEVKNDRVQQFENGVLVRSVDGAHVHKLTAVDNEFGIGVNSSSNVAIHHSDFVDNTGLGVALRFGAHDNTVAHNTIHTTAPASQRPASGIVLFDVDERNRILKNTVSGFGNGIEVAGNSDRNEVVDNSTSDNLHGVTIGLRCDDNLIARNESRQNTFFGIRLEESSRNRIEKNRVSQNDLAGIALDPFGFGGRSNDNVIDSNHIVQNFIGVWLLHSDRNLLRGNFSLDNDDDGIQLFGDSRDNFLEANDAHRNGDDGIDVQSAAPNTLVRNAANLNADYGIVAVPGVIDGGGNRASHNSNPAQCLNVACK